MSAASGAASALVGAATSSWGVRGKITEGARAMRERHAAVGNEWAGLQISPRRERFASVMPGEKEQATAIREARGRTMYRFVHGSCFRASSSILLLVNAAFLGYIAESGIQKDGTHTFSSNTFPVEVAFTIAFLVEILIKFAAGPWLFIFGPEKGWNLMEAMLILQAPFSWADLGLSNAWMTVRLLRTARLLAQLADLKYFHDLRVVVLGIIASIRSLSWVVLVVVLIIYFFAVLFVWGVCESDRLQESDPALDQFGGIFRAMGTLFMSICGGIDWKEAFDALEGLPRIFLFVFLFYIFVMYFAVLNVVIGAVVTATMDISKHDKGAMMQAAAAAQKSFQEKIVCLFAEADVDSSGELSWEEFREHLQNKDVVAYFHALELDVSQAQDLFKMLDVDSTGSISIREFVSGCMHLKNQAKSLDIKLMMYRNELSAAGLKKVLDLIQSRIGNIERRLPEEGPARRGGILHTAAHPLAGISGPPPPSHRNSTDRIERVTTFNTINEAMTESMTKSE